MVIAPRVEDYANPFDFVAAWKACVQGKTVAAPSPPPVLQKIQRVWDRFLAIASGAEQYSVGESTLRGRDVADLQRAWLVLPTQDYSVVTPENRLRILVHLYQQHLQMSNRSLLSALYDEELLITEHLERELLLLLAEVGPRVRISELDIRHTSSSTITPAACHACIFRDYAGVDIPDTVWTTGVRCLRYRCRVGPWTTQAWMNYPLFLHNMQGYTWYETMAYRVAEVLHKRHHYRVTDRYVQMQMRSAEQCTVVAEYELVPWNSIAEAH